MRKNSQGKVLTVFLVITAVLLISLTAISIFFFQKESEQRKSIERKHNTNVAKLSKLDEELKQVKKQNFLLEEKNKEADERINSLLDELDLEEGIREEMKKEAMELKEKVDVLAKERDKIKEKLNNGSSDQGQLIVELKTKLEAEQNINAELKAQNQQLNDRIVSVAKNDFSTAKSEKGQIKPQEKREVELDRIVVVPNEIPDGRILSVDKETDFVIINLGEKDGVKVGTFMSVYRGDEYLGDVSVTRVQPEMSAADLIPPFSSRLVRKNDQVILKQ